MASKKRPTIKAPVKALEVLQKLVDKKPEAKGRRAKGKPEPVATQNPTGKKVIKTAPKALKFRDLWKENVSDIKTFANRVFHDDNNARIYIDYAEGEAPENIRHINSEILDNLYADSKQDVERAYRRALISYNLSQLSAEHMGKVQSLYSGQSIKSWADEKSSPSDMTLDHLEEFGIYLAQGSPLDGDKTHQPPVKSAATLRYKSDDEIFEIFSLRELERVPNLAKDYEHNINNLEFWDYERLGKIDAFRAMLELWPKSFRHYVNSGADVRDLTWTFITEAFTAVVRENRVEVTIGTDASGYTLYASVTSLEEAVARVFCYFDIMGTDQLDSMLETVGFDKKFLAGMKFDLMANRDFNPFAFLKPSYGHAVEIIETGVRFSASDFLLLAAQTTRGVFLEVREDHGTFDEYDLMVADMVFRVMHLDKTAPFESTITKGVASRHLHQRNLTEGRHHLEAHGMYVDEHSVMHLTITEAVHQRVFPEISVEGEVLFISSVTFV